MRAYFHYPASLQNKNLISILDCGKSVSNNEGSPANHQTVQSLLHDALTFRIKSGSCFIQNKNARILQNRTGKLMGDKVEPRRDYIIENADFNKPDNFELPEGQRGEGK